MIAAEAAPVWDCHVHLFGPFDRFPLDPARLYTPVAAPIEALDAHLTRIAADKVVLVQPSPYGADHRCLIDALDRLGARACGVAAWRMDTAGPAHPRIAGLRVHVRAAADPAATLAMAARAAAAESRHLEVQIGPGALAAVAAPLASVPCRVVLDHLGGLGLAPGGEEPAALARLLETGRVWVKYAAPYRVPGGIAAAVSLARWMDARFPGRLMWGSDWPHTPPHPASGERLRPAAFRAADARALADAMLESFDSTARVAIRGGTAEIFYAGGRE